MVYAFHLKQEQSNAMMSDSYMWEICSSDIPYFDEGAYINNKEDIAKILVETFGERSELANMGSIIVDEDELSIVFTNEFISSFIKKQYKDILDVVFTNFNMDEFRTGNGYYYIKRTMLEALGQAGAHYIVYDNYVAESFADMIRHLKADEKYYIGSVIEIS